MSEITAEEYQATVKKGHKYGAKRCEEDGYTFDSLAERKRYRELKLLEQAGEIESHRESGYYVEFVSENRARFGLG